MLRSSLAPAALLAALEAGSRHSVRSIDESDGSTFRDALRNALGIPIRETYAAMGFRLGDLTG